MEGGQEITQSRRLGHSRPSNVGGDPAASMLGDFLPLNEQGRCQQAQNRRAASSLLARRPSPRRYGRRCSLQTRRRPACMQATHTHTRTRIHTSLPYMYIQYRAVQCLPPPLSRVPLAAQTRGPIVQWPRAAQVPYALSFWVSCRLERTMTPFPPMWGKGCQTWTEWCAPAFWEARVIEGRDGEQGL